jgi:hypothetical protein
VNVVDFASPISRQELPGVSSSRTSASSGRTVEASGTPHELLDAVDRFLPSVP